MKNIMIALLALCSTSTFAQSLDVNQTLSTYFYQEGVMNLHLSVFTEGLNTVLKKYDCLQADVKTKITKEPKTRIFSNDEPGKVRITLSTKCHAQKLTGIEFSVSGFGYDEDYTAYNIKLKTKTDQKIVRFCTYGLHDDIRKCPSFQNEKPVYSSEGKLDL